MATREELLRQRINKKYPIGNIAPNLARTPTSTPIQLSGAPLTGPQLPNIARTPASPIVPAPPAPPAPGTGLGILGNQAGPPQIPGGINTGMGALGNQPAAPPPAGPVNPLTNTPVAPRVITPSPAVNSLTNQPVIAPQRSTLGPVPGTPAAAASATSAVPAAPASRSFRPSGMAGPALVGIELLRGAVDTAGRTAAKMESGQGFWQGLGNTVEENLAKAADNPFGLGSISATVNALKEGRVPTDTESNVPIRMVGNLSADPTLVGALDGIVLDPKANRLQGEGVIPYAIRRIKESAVDAYKPIQEDIVNPLGNALFGSESTKSNIKLEPPSADIAPGASINRNIVSRPEGTATYSPNTVTPTLPNTQATPIKNIARRASPENPYGADITDKAIRTNQIRVGALTDAEAARNMESRALQDQATQAEVARLNRATDAMQSLREARSPKFSFGASSIGGGPDTLDVASGRVINRDTPASVVASRMQDAVNTARRFGGFGGGKTGRLIAEEIGKVYLADKALQQSELEAGIKNNQAATTSAADMNKYLLDQQKFAYQQGIDKARLNIDANTLKDKQANTILEQQKYTDTQQKSFMDNFIAPEGAPVDELKSGILAMSKATGLSPDVMNTYVQRVAKANNVDWKNAPPKDLELLFKQATALAASENK